MLGVTTPQCSLVRVSSGQHGQCCCIPQTNTPPPIFIPLDSEIFSQGSQPHKKLSSLGRPLPFIYKTCCWGGRDWWCTAWKYSLRQLSWVGRGWGWSPAAEGSCKKLVTNGSEVIYHSYTPLMWSHVSPMLLLPPLTYFPVTNPYKLIGWNYWFGCCCLLYLGGTERLLRRSSTVPPLPVCFTWGQ